MQGIFDLGDNPLTSFNFSLEFDSSKVFSFKVSALSGYSLKSVNSDHVTYQGRFLDTDPWVDLDAGLDLTPHAGELVEVKIKVTTTESGTEREEKSRLYLTQ